MLKLAIFDDEYIVLQGLRQMIDWTRYGVELVGTAGDGEAALSVCRDCRPDIVFTDIRMPGKSGLQVIEQLMQERPDLVCVVFSGFNEFEYVKRAMNIGAADYLEKPLTIDKFEEGIQKATQRVMQRRALSEIRLEEATRELLLNGETAESKWRECYGPQAEQIVGITVLSISADCPVLRSHTKYRAIPVRIGAERLLVLLHDDTPPAELWEEVASWSESPGLMIGSGRTYPKLGEAPCSYQEAQRALRCRWFREEPGWTRYEHLQGEAAIPASLTERLEAVLTHLRTGNQEGLFRQLDLFLAGMKAERVEPELAEREMLKLVYLGLEAVKERGDGDTIEAKRPGYSPYTELRKLKTRDEMSQWLHGQMDMILGWVMDGRSLPKRKHPSVEKALRYIEDNFHHDLTLQEVADHVGMNAAYFSMLFKARMDISYIKYLTSARIERAKTLLRAGLLVGEVSEKVGYYQYRHFTEVFKKTVGLTPGQYRDANSQ